MATKKPTIKAHKSDREALTQVRARFVLKGSSFNAFCEEHNINRGNAEKAVLGTWAGRKGRALRSQIIQASKAKAKS